MILLLTGLMLSSPAEAADKACKILEKALTRIPESSYTVESTSLPYSRVTVAPAADGLGLAYRYFGKDGAEWKGSEALLCEGGALQLNRFTRHLERPDVEVYNPPLPVLMYPLVEGATWEWTGVLTVGTEEDPLRLVADASFRVDPLTQIELNGQKVDVIPLFHELVVSEAVIQTTSWLRPTPPYALVQEQITFVDPAGLAERQDTWRLAQP